MRAGASAVGLAVLLFPGALLRWTEVPVALQGEVTRYLAVLALALPPALLFRMYSTLNQSLGKPQLVTWLQLAVAGGEDAADDLVRLRRRWACRRWARSAAPGPRWW